MGDNIELERFVIERLRVSLEQIISREILDDSLMLEITLREIGDKVSIQMYRDLGSIHQRRDVSFSTPKTWKDHFKLRYRNNWIIKRWIRKYPIKFGRHIYEVDKMLVFPDFKVPTRHDFINRFDVIQTSLRRDVVDGR